MSSFSVDASIIAQSSGDRAVELMKYVLDGPVNVNECIATFEALQAGVFNSTIGLAGAESIVEIVEAVGNGKRGGNGGGGGNSRGGGNRSGGRPKAQESVRVPDDPAEFVVNNGKHGGKTLAQIADDDFQWLEWAAEEHNNQTIKGQAAKFLAQAA